MIHDEDDLESFNIGTQSALIRQKIDAYPIEGWYTYFTIAHFLGESFSMAAILIR